MAPIDGEWQRVHWATPLLRSWQLVAVAGALFVSSFVNSSGEGDPWVAELAREGVKHLTLVSGLLVLAAVLVLAGIVVGCLFLAWSRYRFRITTDSLELNAGIVFQQHRTARLDRLQSVTISQPFLARIVGLSRLKLEVAGGSGSNISLEFLPEDDAQRLRNHLLARAAGVQYDTVEAPEATSSDITGVPLGRLVRSILFSSALVVFLVSVAVAAGTLIATHSFVGIFFILSGIFTSLGAMWKRFTTGFDFRLATAPDGLRLSYGLLEKKTQTVAPGRIQALEVKQPLLWRLPGWWKIQVNIAGNVGDTDDAGANHLMLPVGTIDDVRVVLPHLVPFLAEFLAERAEAGVDVVAEGLVGAGEGSGFVTSPPRARRLDPWQWRRTGFLATEHALLIRHGRLSRGFVMIPHERTQSLGLYQGPLLRRLDLATVGVHSTPGPVTPRVPRLDPTVAARLVDDQAARARAARAIARPERWMEQSEPLRQPSEPLQQPAEPAEATGVE